MYSPFRHIGSIFWKRKPLHLTFFVTRRCNLRCPFCFYLAGAAPPGPDAPELSLDEVRRISLSLGHLLWLAFSGGEIFLRDDIVEISRIFYENNNPVIMLYPTNGQLPDVIRNGVERILAHCKKSVIVVKLSLDGLSGAHDALRNQPGCFDKTMETYHLLGDLLGRYPHFELGINTVLCSENQDEMDGIIDFVRGLRHDTTHTISLIRGNLLDESYKKVDVKNYERAISRLEHNLKRTGSQIHRFRGARLKAAQDILQRRLIHRTLLAQEGLTPCYAGRLNLVLGETGEVYPCETLTESMGNVRDYGCNMGRIVRSVKARAVLESIERARCHCTHECYFMTNILFNPRWYPTLLREYLRL
jgi:MoaA/NifB/PqqE/SkfB family radical SAM enzyme